MFLSKTYKAMGGTYNTKKNDSKLKNWDREKWL